MQTGGPMFDLLHRIAYSLSYGEVPKVQLPTRLKSYNQYGLLPNAQTSQTYAEDLFEGAHLKLQYRDYLLETLAPALRVAVRGDFPPGAILVQGPAEYFVLSCPDGSEKLFWMGPYAQVIGLVPTQQQLDKVKSIEMTAATPSNMSLAELIHMRQTRRPHGDLWVKKRN
jgi:hypothetical protein